MFRNTVKTTVLLTPTAAPLLQMALSRSRELEADPTTAERVARLRATP